MKNASVWDGFVKVESPNGLYEAVFNQTSEIGMGGPATGTLVIIEKSTQKQILTLEGVNGSFVWCEDSGAIACPKWDAQRNQNLAIMRVPSGKMVLSTDKFSVLELEEFTANRIEGIDSPIFQPRRIRIPLG